MPRIKGERDPCVLVSFKKGLLIIKSEWAGKVGKRQERSDAPHVSLETNQKWR